MLKVVCYLYLMFFSLSLHAQSVFSIEKELPDMEDSLRVDYINKNFYKLYSDNFEKARSMTNWALDISNKNSWKTRQAYSALHLGVITYLSGEYEEVLPLYIKSLKLFDSLKDDSGKARVNNEMAVFYHKQENLDEAYKCLDEAESISRRIGDLESLGTALGHRASFLMRRGKILESKPFIDEVYRIRKQQKDSVGLGYVLNDLAAIATEEGRFNEALDYINQSTKIRQAIGDRQGVAINLVNTGEYLIIQEKYAEAVDYLKKGAEAGLALKYTDLVRFTYDKIAECYIQLQQFENALEYRDKGYQLKDSLFAIEKTKNIAELQTQYETEKKEQQIRAQQLMIAEEKAINERNMAISIGVFLVLVFLVVLVWIQKSRLRKKQQLELQQKDIEFKQLQLSAVIDSQEKERRRFASDLHDGFGQLISILKLNVESVRKQDDREKRHSIYEKSVDILNEMYGELKSICFNLMPQSLVKFGLEPSLKEFANKINATEKMAVDVIVFDLAERLSELQEISLYRIVQEWVNNILKYSDATQVTIQITKDQREITLTVEDNGMGFELIKLTEGKGNGWKNIRSRANLIKGDLEIDSTPGKRGNMFILNIPVDIPQTVVAEEIATH